MLCGLAWTSASRGCWLGAGSCALRVCMLVLARERVLVTVLVTVLVGVVLPPVVVLTQVLHRVSRACRAT